VPFCHSQSPPILLLNSDLTIRDLYIEISFPTFIVPYRPPDALMQFLQEL